MTKTGFSSHELRRSLCGATSHEEGMTRAPPLTAEQKEICRENRTRFPTDIARLPGMEGTTPRQIADYLRKPEHNEHAVLADQLEKYIEHNGLPTKHSGVISFIRYLRGKA